MEKKKKSVIKKVFIVILCVVLFVILSIAALFLYSSLDKKKSLAMLPHDYSLYIHTDSAWNTLEPLLDLKAVDMYFSSPEMSTVRGIFMQLRASQFRNSKLLAYVASKSIDIGIYNNSESNINFLACVDLKALSVFTRFFPFYLKLLNIEIENLAYQNDYFIYTNEDTKYYLKAYKNLLLATNDYSLLEKALAANYDNYSKQDLQLINKKSEEPVKIIANAKKLLETFQKDEESAEIVSEIMKVIPNDSLSSITLKVTDNHLKLNAHIPYDSNNLDNFSLKEVLNNHSTTPAILSRFRENVQYYTILNIGTLEQLKNAFMPFFIDNADLNWKKYNNLSKTYLSITLDDLLFSWSGNEVVIFGIENKNDPIFGIQIKDEKQRQNVFEKFLSSVLVKDNSSLILDGIRIPRIELPSFLQELLALFDISLPKPYYLIQDGFIYFTESPENLCEIYKSENKIGKISADENWNVISKDLTSDSNISLYYNLDRSIPFFLKSKASLSKVIGLYSIGRTDFSIKDSEFLIQLSAISTTNVKTDKVAGFPKQLNGKIDGELILESGNAKAKSNAIYWTENKKKIVSMEIPSTTITEYEANDTVFVTPLIGKSYSEDKSVWCVTGHGAVYIMNRKLKPAEKFPIFINDNISVRPVSVNDGLLITTDSKRLIYVDTEGIVREIPIVLTGSVKSKPEVFEYSDGRKMYALYDKSFTGKVLLIQDWEGGEVIAYDVPGISYGSPCFVKNDDDAENPLLSFITQNGQLYIWNFMNGECNIITLEGKYKTNVVAVENCLYVLSTSSVLSKIKPNEEILSIQLPDVTCNEAFVTVENDNIYICPDGNVIYGFDKNLELLYSFPITGWGRPVFADINGDKNPDCFTLSVDNKLYVTNLR